MTGEELGIRLIGAERDMVGSNREEKGTEEKTTLFRRVWNGAVWHGGSVYDAWLNSVAIQVGSLILTLPYTFAQMGYWFGSVRSFFMVLLGAGVSILSVYFTPRLRVGPQPLVPYMKNMFFSIVAGKTLGNLDLAFNMTALAFVCVLQLIGCSSHVYYMNSNWNKRQWLYLFGALAIPTVLLPSFHNFRVASFLGIVTTSITSAYMTVAAIQHGQIANVKHQGPENMVDFFTGATNILFTFGSQIAVELMEAMWKPNKYKYVYIFAVLYIYLLTIPNSVAVYWAYGDILIQQLNAFGILPPSKMKNVCIIAMILHQYVAFLLNANPLFLAWEKVVGVHTSRRFVLRALARVSIVLVIWFFALALPFFGPINSVVGAFVISFSVYIIPSVAFMKACSKKQLETAKDEIAKCGPLMYWTSAVIATWALVFGFGFGGWASSTNFIRQIKSFGFFDECYQCPPKH